MQALAIPADLQDGSDFNYCRDLGAALRLNSQCLSSVVSSTDNNATQCKIHKMLCDFVANGFAGRTREKFLHDHHEIHRDTIWKYMGVMATMVLNYDREWRRRLEMSTTFAPKLLKLQYIDVDMADETPMPVLTRDDSEQTGTSSSESPDARCLVVLGMGPLVKAKPEVEPTKNLQSVPDSACSCTARKSANILLSVGAPSIHFNIWTAPQPNAFGGLGKGEKLLVKLLTSMMTWCEWWLKMEHLRILGLKGLSLRAEVLHLPTSNMAAKAIWLRFA